MAKKETTEGEFPFEYDVWPFEFNPAYDGKNTTYFKFGWEPGERIPDDSGRNPGSYGANHKFIKDQSIEAVTVRRDALDEERCFVARLIHRYEALKAMAKTEMNKAADNLKREEGLLYLWGGGTNAAIGNSQTGEVKKTLDSLKHWSRTQPSYIEAQAWCSAATTQYEYIEGTYKNLCHIKSKMIMSLASDARQDRQMDLAD